MSDDQFIYDVSDDEIVDSCLSLEDLWEYGKGKTLYGWHISDLVIYDKPKSINDFKKYNRDPENSACSHMPKSFYLDCSVCKECGLTRPPQSWCYVEVSNEV